MRLWSIHPKYLDRAGLLAVWREGLLAKKVIQNKTKGYKKHPQLVRFKKCKDPVFAIECYLFEIYKEAERRGYNFDIKKINRPEESCKPKGLISVTSGQAEFEFRHLLKKLKTRDKPIFDKIKNTKEIELNPIFIKIPGKKESWEKGS
ncbi:MAG: pyrimidine dimer DNA glycosylase/endonuclease V [Candidatus Aenigmatarchaeota archaeon]